MAKSMKRRCRSHDYSDRCIYMVTISKEDYIEPFCEIRNIGTDREIRAQSNLSRLGHIISYCLRQIPIDYPDAKILQYAIMPDHIHFVIYIMKKVDYHLGTLIGNFTGNCTRANNNQPIFTEGFNDRIVRKKGQLDLLIKYVRDNPYRLLVRQLNPHLFSKCHTIIIDGKAFSSYGNFMLLRNPYIEPVRISSRFTPDELSRRKRVWTETIRQQGVLVSPFISKAEKEIRDRAIEEGASIILIERENFAERYKPAGKLFDLCTEGRALIISLGDERSDSPSVTRTEALRMNDLAEYLATSAAASMTLRPLNPPIPD